MIGESKNDIQVIKKLIESKIQNVIADVSFLELGGIEFLKYYIFLFHLQIFYTPDCLIFRFFAFPDLF